MDERKKQREQTVLNKVYQESMYQVIPSESPDFLLYDEAHEVRFGVEITELYLSQTRAKLFNKPIHTLKPYTDVKHSFMKLYTRNKDTSKWNRFSMHEILSNIPTFEEYQNKIISIIKNKSEKSVHYNTSIEYLDLLIEDCEKYFKYVDVRFFKLLSESQELKDAISASAFHRVYLLSEYNDQELLIMWEGRKYV